MNDEPVAVKNEKCYVYVHTRNGKLKDDNMKVTGSTAPYFLIEVALSFEFGDPQRTSTLQVC